MSALSSDKATVRLPSDVRVVNVGLDMLGDAVRSQGKPVVDVDWRIPAQGDTRAIRALERLMGPHSDRIDAANAQVIDRLDNSAPLLCGIEQAADAIATMGERTLLHCGPPLAWEDFADPLRRSARASAMAEGWADTPAEVDEMMKSGAIELASANEHSTVVPMATTVGPSQPVFVVELDGLRAFSPINQGPGQTAWFGVDRPEAVERLRWLAAVAGPILDKAIRSSGPIDVFAMAGQGLQMGDDLHMRTQATGNLLLRHLFESIVATGHPKLEEFARYWSSNHLFFLNIAMAAAKAVTTAAMEVKDSSIVLGMARNGTTFGVRLAAGGGRWFTAGAPPVQHAMFQSGYSEQDAAADIGDSAVLELIGLGGPAAAGAPAVAAFVGGSMSDARRVTDQMAAISVARSGRFKMASLDYIGTPVGVDVRKVVELGITPSVNTGILHASDGDGQVGAGVAVAPIECFVDALLFLDSQFG